jgi:DNA-binding response OmpR family regulator
MVAALVGIATSQGLRFELGAHATVGRGAASTIVLPDPLVSSVHAELLRDKGGRYRIVDLDATHGTFVNGSKVADHVLAHGDEIIVGATRLRFEDAPGTTVTAPFGFPRAAELDVPVAVGRDYERLRLAFEVGRAVADGREVYPLVSGVLDRVLEALPAERGVVLIREPGSDTLMPRALRRRGAGEVGLAVPRAILDQVTTHKVGMLALDASVDDRFATNSVLDGRIRSALAVPMVDAGELIGVIYLDAHAAGVFAERDLEVMGMVAGVTGLAIGGIRRRAFEAEAPGVRGATVVVVDPDAGTRGVIAAMLERGGYAVEAAASGDAALATAARRELHVAVIDLDLGPTGMTARQLGERFRGVAAGGRVLYVATAADPAEVEELTAGGDGFVAKPFTAAELVARVRTALAAAGDPDIARRRLELSASYPNGAAFVAAYAASTNRFALPRREPLPVDRAITVTVRLEDVEREFRIHGRTAEGGRVVFGDDAARDLLLSCARGESIPYFRRAHPRHPVRLAVRMSAPDGLAIVSHSQDVSARGIMLSTDHKLEVGTLVGLRIAFPGRDEPLEVGGKIQSAIATGPRRGVGIEFQFTSQAQRTEVADRVAKLGQ